MIYENDSLEKLTEKSNGYNTPVSYLLMIVTVRFITIDRPSRMLARGMGKAFFILRFCQVEEIASRSPSPSTECTYFFRERKICARPWCGRVERSSREPVLVVASTDFVSVRVKTILEPASNQSSLRSTNLILSALFGSASADRSANSKRGRRTPMEPGNSAVCLDQKCHMKRFCQRGSPP